MKTGDGRVQAEGESSGKKKKKKKGVAGQNEKRSEKGG